MRRGDVYYADLNPVEGSEQGGVRPVLIIQNNIGNRFSPTVVISAITSKINKAELPTHVEVSSDNYLKEDSIILLEQIRTVDKSRLQNYVTHLGKNIMGEVDKAIKISLGLVDI